MIEGSERRKGKIVKRIINRGKSSENGFTSIKEEGRW